MCWQPSPRSQRIVSPLMMSLAFRQFTHEDTALYLPGAPFLLAALIEFAGLVVIFFGRQANAQGRLISSTSAARTRP